MHDYARDPQSGVGNCNCGAEQRHRVHWHDFTASLNSPVRCVCGLPASASCHTSALGSALATVVQEEIRSSKPVAPKKVPAYSSSWSQCGHNGEIDYRSQHICLCNRSAFHPLDGNHPHRCDCGKAWADETQPTYKVTEIPIRDYDAVKIPSTTLVPPPVHTGPTPAYPNLHRCGHADEIHDGADHICLCTRSAFHPLDSLAPHTCECGKEWSDQPLPEPPPVEEFDVAIPEFSPPTPPKPAYTETRGYCGDFNLDGIGEDHLCMCTRSAFSPHDDHSCECGKAWNHNVEIRQPAEEFDVKIPEFSPPAPPMPAYPETQRCGNAGIIDPDADHICLCAHSAFEVHDSHACECGKSWTDFAPTPILAEEFDVKIPEFSPPPEPRAAYDGTQICGHNHEIDPDADHICVCTRSAFDLHAEHGCECGKSWSELSAPPLPAEEFDVKIPEFPPPAPPHPAYAEVRSTCGRVDEIDPDADHICVCTRSAFNLHTEHGCECGKSWSEAGALPLPVEEFDVEIPEFSPPPEPRSAYSDEQLCGHVNEIDPGADHICMCSRGAFHEMASSEPHICECGRAWSEFAPPEIPREEFDVKLPEFPDEPIVRTRPAYPDTQYCGCSDTVDPDAGHICVCTRSAFHAIDSLAPHRCDCGNDWADATQIATHRDVPRDEFDVKLPEFSEPAPPPPAYTRSDLKRCGHPGGAAHDNDHMCMCGRDAFHDTNADQPHVCHACGKSWADREWFRDPEPSPEVEAAFPEEEPKDPIIEATPAYPRSGLTTCGHSGGLSDDEDHICFCSLPAFHPVGGAEGHRCVCGNAWNDVHRNFDGDLPRVVKE